MDRHSRVGADGARAPAIAGYLHEVAGCLRSIAGSLHEIAAGRDERLRGWS